MHPCVCMVDVSQNWGTLRFSDHRGLSPNTVTVTSSCFSTVLTRSKTIGADKSIGPRPVTIDSCYYFAEQVGFKLLQQLAPFTRDYLLPSLASSLTRAIAKEMRYETGYGLQNRVLHLESQFRTQEEPFCRPQQHCLGSTSQTGTSWADGPPREATGTPEYHARKLQTCKRR